MKRNILKLVEDGFFREAILLYSQRHSSSSRPHRFTFPPLLKACAKLKNASQGRILHTHLLKTGFLADFYSATALTGMYMKLGLIDEGLKVFDEMPDRSLASMNAAISGLTHNGYFREALWVIRSGRYGEFRPNSVTIASLLPACEKSVRLAGTMHCWAIKLGVEKDVYVATSILTVYLKCKEVVLAAKLFKEMPNKNLVSYNALISGLLRCGLWLEVLDAFKQMMERLEEKPNHVTLVSAISACAGLSYIVFGRQVHGMAIKTELVLNIMVGTALVDMYSKCGVWQRAYDVFKELNDNRNLVTWNAMISGMMLNAQSENAVVLFKELLAEGLESDLAIWNSMIIGFAQLGKGIDAFKYFKRMQSAGVAPNLKSITSMLSACSDLSALRSGKEIHGHATRKFVNNDRFMATALMDFYMKCGLYSWARRVFDCVDVKPDDPAFWNAMISGYGRNGDNESAFRIFDKMLEEKVQPNAGTFVSLLSACSHTGQVDKGWKLFRMMITEFGLKPNPIHLSCMVDLLARSGRLDDARELIQNLSEASASVFASLLGACGSNLNSDLGEVMAKRLLELQPESPIPYVVLSNIYAGLGRWKDVERIRRMMDDKECIKFAGFSLLEVT
ncbi:Pentatricopeptide repeat [Trema orientale]|uniref:Pentatricopeptide repeat n=1 Tax=Trema orientale TaxID=63057 RepID=A0A2P5FQE2_TREOI|nr:Pentatricopeptide repeat [Trema orientale]